MHQIFIFKLTDIGEDPVKGCVGVHKDIGFRYPHRTESFSHIDTRHNLKKVLIEDTYSFNPVQHSPVKLPL